MSRDDRQAHTRRGAPKFRPLLVTRVVAAVGVCNTATTSATASTSTVPPAASRRHNGHCKAQLHFFAAPSTLPLPRLAPRASRSPKPSSTSESWPPFDALPLAIAMSTSRRRASASVARRPTRRAPWSALPASSVATKSQATPCSRHAATYAEEPFMCSAASRSATRSPERCASRALPTAAPSVAPASSETAALYKASSPKLRTPRLQLNRLAAGCVEPAIAADDSRPSVGADPASPLAAQTT
mmetsp:Transcript_43372/g.120024  ORF Transcript_43372/g.120024 Transcript_43372/m.120024 type:complete len:243 (+) Transcript_43372:56-784(+)